MTVPHLELDRRECLRLLVPLVVGNWATTTHTLAQPRGVAADELNELLASERFASARDAGKIFLEAHPEEADLEQLKDRIFDGVQPDEDPSAILSFVDRKIRGDFDQARTVVVQFWVLSITECRVYGLAHLQA